MKTCWHVYMTRKVSRRVLSGIYRRAVVWRSLLPPAHIVRAAVKACATYTHSERPSAACRDCRADRRHQQMAHLILRLDLCTRNADKMPSQTAESRNSLFYFINLQTYLSTMPYKIPNGSLRLYIGF